MARVALAKTFAGFIVFALVMTPFMTFAQTIEVPEATTETNTTEEPVTEAAVQEPVDEEVPAEEETEDTQSETAPRTAFTAEPETIAVPYKEVTGFKWRDVDGDGEYDNGEPKLEGWEIVATRYEEDEEGDEEDVITTTTDENGEYSLDLPPGVWYVTETMQKGWEQTYPDNEMAGCVVEAFVAVPIDETILDARKDIEWDEEYTETCNFGNKKVSNNSCEVGKNLLKNGSFEAPIVGDAGWDVYESGSGLEWIVNWVLGLGAPETPVLELQNYIAYEGYDAADGEQYAELDSDYDGPGGSEYNGENTSVRISQDISTTPGKTYTFTFAFSALPGLNANDNKARVIINGVEEDIISANGNPLSNTDWNYYSYTFVATGENTNIALEDAGIVNSLGTLVDDATLCEEPEVEVPVCEIGDNLLKNGSFETPAPTTNGGDWEIFAAVTDWAISSSGLEIWANGFFGGPSEGEQNAELDGNESTTITQNVTTIPGALYELRFDFSARPDVLGNSLDAIAGGNVIKSVSDTGIGQTETEWTTHSQLFTATTTSTDIAFADTSVSDSYGSLIDNTVLCLVREPQEPQSCSVTVVSDATNTVAEKDGAFAQLLTFIHEKWTASIPGASWIWGDNPVANPVPDTIQTFTKEFVWEGPVTDVSLMIAADNSYTVRLNGNVIGSSTDEDNHSLDTQDSYTTFSGVVVTGTNTLEIEVKNWAQEGANAESNPAGLIYKLVVTGTDATCSEVPGDDGDGGGSNGGGGSGKKVSLGGGSNGDDEDEGEVLGDSDAAPEVMGAVAPVGAPNAGMGGAATGNTFALVVPFIGMLLAFVGVRRTN